MSNIDKYIEGFDRGSCCSQVILSIYAPYFGLDEKIAHKLGTGWLFLLPGIIGNRNFNRRRKGKRSRAEFIQYGM